MKNLRIFTVVMKDDFQVIVQRNIFANQKP